MCNTAGKYSGECEKDSNGVPVCDAIGLAKDDSGKVIIEFKPLSVATYIKSTIWDRSADSGHDNHANYWECKSYVCLSGTIGQSFCERNGLKFTVTAPSGDKSVVNDSHEIQMQHVFNYKKNMQIYISSHNAAKDPPSPRWDELNGFIRDTTRACLLLFTNKQYMGDAYGRLSEEHNKRRVFLAGGDVARGIAMLKDNAVVCGCERYWTGVDVPSMHLVYVERLPYASNFKTSSNLMEMCELEKLSLQYSREDMRQQLLQGMGRLIRNNTSNGKVYISDSRAWRAAKDCIKAAFPGARITWLSTEIVTMQRPYRNNSSAVASAPKRQKIEPLQRELTVAKVMKDSANSQHSVAETKRMAEATQIKEAKQASTNSTTGSGSYFDPIDLDSSDTSL